MTKTHKVIIQDRTGKKERWLFFSNPIEVIETGDVAEIAGKLTAVEEGTKSGLYAAGFISYEAAPAFDPAFKVRPPSPLPLLWFGLYEKAETVPALPPGNGSFTLGEWTPSVDQTEYGEAIKRIKDYIAAGDTYQVNYTIRLHSRFQGDPYGFWLKLLRAQPTGYAAYLETDRFAVCSASPELFFHLKGPKLLSRPMKGTAPRGRTLSEDEERMEWLKNSTKNRAENLMIVDMVRNDMGRIAETGTVKVKSLFDIERYPTVLQMTSTVSSETAASFPEIIASLFPCASITGAPKIRTTEIVAELETEPRGVYTGCIGFISPRREAQFNVAIRTVEIDRETSRAVYGVGGGIVWDSEADDEYGECLTKSHLLSAENPDFELLESILWEPDGGYFLLGNHLKRLRDSGEYFCFPIDLKSVQGKLEELTQSLDSQPHKIRLLIDRDGKATLDSKPIEISKKEKTWKISIAEEPVDPQNPFLYHKTTNRKVYQNAKNGREGCDDVILWNEEGEVTESTIANVVIRVGEDYFTPTINSGLLPGTYRAKLLEEGKIKAKIITLDELKNADSIHLINSVRKWVKAEMEKQSR